MDIFFCMIYFFGAVCSILNMKTAEHWFLKLFCIVCFIFLTFGLVIKIIDFFLKNKV